MIYIYQATFATDHQYCHDSEREVLTLGTFNLVFQFELIDIGSSAVSRDGGRVIVRIDEVSAFTSDHIGVLRVSLTSSKPIAYVGDRDELLISIYHDIMGETYGYSSSSSSVGVTKSVTKTLHLVGLELLVSFRVASVAYFIVVGNNYVVSRLGSSLQTGMSLNCG
jgi:hypothetical protein